MRLKKTFLGAVCVFSLAACFPQTAAADSIPSQVIPLEQLSGSSISPQSDIIEWMYKIENGKLYKRKYNTSTRSWIGQWIYICDYPG